MEKQTLRPPTYIPVEVANVVVHALQRYKNRDQEPEDFLREYIKKEEVDMTLQPEVIKMFLSILLVEKFLQKVVDEYYQYKGRRIKDDQSLLTVILYLILYRLSADATESIRDVLLYLHPVKSSHVLGFMSRQQTMVCVSQLASSFFDTQYVRDNVFREVGPVQAVHKMVTNHLEDEKQARRPQPTVPLKIRIPQNPRKASVDGNEEDEEKQLEDEEWRFVPTVVPNSTYSQSAERRRLLAERTINKLNATRKLEEVQKTRFACADPQKSERFLRTVKTIELEREAESAKPPRVVKREPDTGPELPVRKNAATVLREAATLAKEDREAVARLYSLASGSCDHELYERLAAELQLRAEREAERTVERRHLMGLISREEAVLARERLRRENRARREQCRRESEQLERQLAVWRDGEEAKIQGLVSKVRRIEHGAKEAQRGLLGRRHKEAQETNEKNKAMIKETIQKKREELVRRVQLIRELRALQKVHSLRQSKFDPTTTVGLGLMCEMSVAELRERLFLLHVDLREELEARKKEVRERREAREQRLAKSEALVEREREARKQQPPKPETKVVSDIADSEEIKKLRQVLEEKRELRKKLCGENT